jgi:hypothetical protein
MGSSLTTELLPLLLPQLDRLGNVSLGRDEIHLIHGAVFDGHECRCAVSRRRHPRVCRFDDPLCRRQCGNKRKDDEGDSAVTRTHRIIL